MTSELGFCVHAHFYQPPREDPLTGVVPDEAGAAPYANWNERIDRECYRPNAELGNYRRISFNIGPTLFDWMEQYDDATAAAIVAQDRENLAANGVGNAMAQPYNHTILPLANRRDKETQVRWGVADFVHRFGRKPQGMWLPETAVDVETLEVLADQGIRFTILAPWQAKTPDLDASQPYRVRLNSGKSLAVFFYHQELSARISFDPGFTINADDFVLSGLLPRYRREAGRREGSQLILVASDGELYGHHQPFRDKFLAHLLNGAIRSREVLTTYPALWLRKHPARKIVEIRENTSWSCHHGVSRWKEDCGCTPGSLWKAPFREALDRIGIELDRVYQDGVARLEVDPWELRNQYIHVVLGETSLEEQVHAQGKGNLEKAALQRLHLLLRSQYERQRMFTSCGWFFDEFDRIEPKNNIAYAAQAIWLARLATGIDLSSQSALMLRKIKSARSGIRADTIFNRHLRRAKAALADYSAELA